ncbi:MAG: tetratricopeptide repeat protein, partial [Acidobacteriota bacterium]|nr:tetratricopeptide repeat protein [Acidobacteriota bacterium]
MLWFEQLRMFFEQNGLLAAAAKDQGRPPLRIISFRTAKEYEEYRPRADADAAYISDEDGDYIIMASLEPGTFCVAAHEYTHYVLHTNGLKLPPWLNEGLAEFFSTLKVSGSEYELGGDLPARRQTLRRTRWLPLTALLEAKDESATVHTRKADEIFYAESWALVDMLSTSGHYSAGFRELISEFKAGSNPAEAFRKVYGESLDQVAKSLENWVGQARSTRGILAKPVGSDVVLSRELSVHQANTILAQLSFVTGHFERARIQYEELSREEPDNSDLPAALGRIALRQGNRDEALKQWRRALRIGTSNASLCYHFALLSEEAGLDAQVEEAALERAVALFPRFDEARYKLALLQNRAGEYRSAVKQLQSMEVPAGARRYGYWVAMTNALTELDARDE